MNPPPVAEVERVARKAWGEPNAALSSRRELRWGSKGSKRLRLNKLIWEDFETGEKGGYVALYRLAGEPLPNGHDASPSVTYDYRDDKGALQFQVVRNPLHYGQRFYQRRPDGAGGWITGKGVMKGVAPLPYRLPALINSNGTVFVVEGEKDGDNLAGIGLTATTNHGGAGKWRAEISRRLEGGDVVILPDNDDAGRKHAADVARKLDGIASRIRILVLPGLRPKGDVSDWLAAGGTREQLLELAKAAPDFLPAAGDGDALTPGDDEALDDDAEIRRLAALRPLAYERVRAVQAGRLGVRPVILDRLVKAERGDNGGGRLQGRPVEFPAPELWPNPVDGAELLVDLTNYFANYLHAPDRAPATLALWVLHTYCFQMFRHTPRLNFKSVTKRSGKSTALDLLQLVVAKSLRAENISVPATFRVVEIAAPTLLIDEADRFLPANDELVGLLNAGYARGGQAVRCVGEDAEARAFSVFAPAAIAGIGTLPGTLADRAIVVPMQRAKRGEQKSQIDETTEARAAELVRRAARWVADNTDRLASVAPDMGQLFARAAQIWKPLYAIAEVAGDNWPDLVAKASEALAGDDDDAETLGVKLLADTRIVLEAEAKDKGMELADVELSTMTMVERLLAMEDRPWPEMPSRRGAKSLTTAGFTRLVKQFGALRQKLGPRDSRVWGYRAADFTEAWNRYLDA